MFENLKKIWSRVPTAWAYLFAVETNLEEYAKRELELSFTGDDEYTNGIRDSVLSVVRVFSVAGHSGMSASATLATASKLMNWQPLTNLTGKRKEWTDVAGYGTETLYQNKRCSRVFWVGGAEQAYDIDGYVFEEPDGSRFTGTNSKKYFDFPYYPTTAYIQVPEDSTKEQQLEAIAKYEEQRIQPM